MNSKLILPIILVAVLLLVTTQLGTLPVTPKSEGGEPAAQEVPIGGSFTLTDQNGNKVSDTDFRGKKLLVFFGFTNCPDVCPTALSVLSTALEDIDKDKVQVLFITVDPERDTPEVIREYLRNFDSSIIGLTGTEEELKAVQKLYHAYAAKVETKQPDHAGHDDHAAHGAHGGGHSFTMAHSDLVYLMDENGEFVTHFSREDNADKIAARVNR